MTTAPCVTLNAIGLQDIHLITDDTNESLFKPKVPQHSNFTKYQRATKITNPGISPSWPFGETIKVTMLPKTMGDLLSNMYFYIELPWLGPQGGNDAYINYTGNGYWSKFVGLQLIESITMRVDNTEIETIDGDWMFINQELYLNDSERKGNIASTLASSNFNLFNPALRPDVTTARTYPVLLRIPFFFSRNFINEDTINKPYFPICAIWKQKIEFTLTFHKQSFFTNYSNSFFIPTFSLLTEEITIEDAERAYYKNNKNLMITSLVKKHPIYYTSVGSSLLKLNIVPNIPVKCIHWFFRRSVFESGTAENMDNVFNFTRQNDLGFNTLIQNPTNGAYYNNFYTTLFKNGKISFPDNVPVMKSARFFFNGFKFPDAVDDNELYYKYLVPHHADLNSTTSSIYTMSFAMHPTSFEPSGSLDFNLIHSENSIMTVDLEDNLTDQYTMHIYYTGYQTFYFKDGFMSLAY